MNEHVAVMEANVMSIVAGVHAYLKEKSDSVKKNSDQRGMRNYKPPCEVRFPQSPSFEIIISKIIIIA